MIFFQAKKHCVLDLSINKLCWSLYVYDILFIQFEGVGETREDIYKMGNLSYPRETQDHHLQESFQEGTTTKK